MLLLGCTQLQTLRYGRSKWIGRDSKAFRFLTCLQQVDLSHDQFAEAYLDDFVHLTALHTLSLSDCGICSFSKLSQLSSLEDLNLCDTYIRDDELYYLVQLPRLRVLQLADCPYISDLFSLCVRFAATGGVSDKGLVAVCLLSLLQRLWLGNCSKVTDDGVRCLSSL